MEIVGRRLAHTLADTEALAHEFAAIATPGSCFVLDGQLGAGKTAFAKALLAALGVKEMVTSPTFNLVKEYRGKCPIYHMDLYRIEGVEWQELGLEEYFTPDSVVVIEWNCMDAIDADPIVFLQVTVEEGGARNWTWKIVRQGLRH